MNNSSMIISAMKKANTMIGYMEAMRSNFDRKLATKFSIFEPTGYDERTISKIIRLLLDPKGGHGQGSNFLKEFLKYLCETLPNNNKITGFKNPDY